MAISEQERAYLKEYRQRPEVRAANLERMKPRRQNASYREANNARNRQHESKPAWDSVRRRVQRGVTERQPCVYFGKANGLAHHEDYSKPLEVVWVCHVHHAEIHTGTLKVLPQHITLLPVKKVQT